MTTQTKKTLTAQCVCGAVAISLAGTPILGATCFCSDCQAAGHLIEVLPNAPAILDENGGTPFLLYRKDRLTFARGESLVTDHRLTPESVTRRVIAQCCNSPMFLDFQRGHWFSVWRERIIGEVPPLQMNVQTKFRLPGVLDDLRVPNYPGYPPNFMFKLILARLAMIFGN